MISPLRLRLFAIFVAFVGAIVVASALELHSHADSIALVARIGDARSIALDRTLQVMGEISGARGYFATHDRRDRESFSAAKHELLFDTLTLQRRLTGDTTIDASIAAATSAIAQIEGASSAAIVSASKRNDATAVTALSAIDTLFDAYRRQDRMLQSQLTIRLAEQRKANLNFAVRASFFPPLFGIAIVVAAAAFMILLHKRARMREATQRNKHLEQTNHLMRMAEEMANVGYWQLDLRTRKRHWSDEVYRIFGLPPGSALTTDTVLTAYVEDDRARVGGLIEDTIANGTGYTCETRIVRADGAIRDVLVIGRLERAADGTPLVLKGAFQDITERKTIERERDGLIDRFKLANQAGKVGVWDWDIGTNAVLWDDNMFALRGRDVIAGAQRLDGIVFETTHPDDRDRLTREIGHTVATGEPFKVDYRVIWPAGDVHHIRAQGTVMFNAANEPIRMLGTDWDITESRLLAEQLQVEKEQLLAAKLAAEEANHVKSDFLASMSHEIRTPMNGILGLTSVLLDGDPTIEQQRHLTLLADAGRSLLAIINDILDLSKVEAGKIELESIALTPAGLVDGALAIVSGEALAKNITLDVAIGADVPAWVNGDPTRLRQILLNLLTNALKFTERGRVTVRVRRDVEAGPNMLRFEVADTGIGIAPDRQHLLFQNFSQLDRSNARKYGGTGLGLAISRRLAEAMSGSIGVESTLGAGSVFWFSARLPVTIDATAASLPAIGRAIFDGGRRILVVDDNPINQVVARALLNTDGHEVVLVADGVQALAAVQGSPFDVVLMDMQMPVMDGIEATRHIRALKGPVRNIPIVALTANAMADQIARCRDAGMNDHLAKPIDRERLRHVVAIWTMSGDWKREPYANQPESDRRAASAPDAQAIALETELLLELFDGDSAAVDALLHAALASIRTDIQRIDIAVAADDRASVIDAAHRIRGTCGSLRARDVLESSAAIERIAMSQASTVPPALLAQLHAEVDRLGSQIRAHAERTNSGSAI